MTKLLTTVVVFAIVFSSCKSTSKAFQRGEYTDAIAIGVRKLQKDPSDAKTRDLVRSSYSYEVTEHEDRIRILSNSTSDLRFDDIYQEYGHLQNLYNIIHQYPAVAQMIPAKDYSTNLQEIGDQATGVHLSKAERWMSEHNKPAYREALKEYNIALRYHPDDIEIRKNRDIAYDNAITKVVVAPMQQFNGYMYSSSYQLSNFQNEVLRIFANSMHNDMLRFYSDYEAKTKHIQPDQILEMNFTRIMIGQPVDQRDTREISKQVVVKEIVYKPDSVIKQYGTVTAKIVNIKRTLISQGDLFITVRDTRGTILWNDHFTGENRWNTEFASFSGDERALSDSDKSLCGKGEVQSPYENKIMADLMNKIQSDLCARMNTYYSKAL